MNSNDLDSVISALRTNNNFVITSHVNPEGDSIGSQLALSSVLRAMGKNAVIVNRDPVPRNLLFLAGASSIWPEIPEGFYPETCVILDCPVKERVGKVDEYTGKCGLIINVDHHVSNEFFGDINWVDLGMSSAGEMVYHIIKKTGIRIDKLVAEALYSAIVTDTGMFNYENTAKSTHVVAGDLIECGVNPLRVFHNIYENKTAMQIKFLGKVLSTICMEENGRVAHITLKREMYEEEGVEFIALDEFINYPRSIEGVEVAVFFTEKDKTGGTVNVSLRSNGGVDVNMVASRFGGGGHKKASGCIIRSTLTEAKEKVLSEVKKAVRET